MRRNRAARALVVRRAAHIHADASSCQELFMRILLRPRGLLVLTLLLVATLISSATLLRASPLAPSSNPNATVASFAGPTCQVEPGWPNQLPNNWIIGQDGGLCGHKANHIWADQRPESDAAD